MYKRGWAIDYSKEKAAAEKAAAPKKKEVVIETPEDSCVCLTVLAAGLLTFFGYAKRLDILKESFPKFSRVALLHAGGSDDHEELSETRAAAPVLGSKFNQCKYKIAPSFRAHTQR